MKILERLFFGGKFLEGNWIINSCKEKKQVVREERQYVSATSTAVQTVLASVDFRHQLILWTVHSTDTEENQIIYTYH